MSILGGLLVPKQSFSTKKKSLFVASDDALPIVLFVCYPASTQVLQCSIWVRTTMILFVIRKGHVKPRNTHLTGGLL